ncbi:MAG: hypothetical protein VX589_07440 [Myxococcota bacterium]|nr:hypothetical protein [Myxococcota bacterium]
MKLRLMLWIAFIGLLACGSNDGSSSPNRPTTAASGGVVATDTGGATGASPSNSPRPTMGNDGSKFTWPALASGPIEAAITLTLTENKETHIIAVDEQGSAGVRLTATSAGWSYHALSPDGRYLAAVQHAANRTDGRPDVSSPGAIWIVDLNEKAKNADGTLLTDDLGRSQPLSYPLTPEGCDAGIGGLGWASSTTIAFAMSCDGTPSIAYLASVSERGRTSDNFLIISSHDGSAVRDVNPAVGSPFFAYVVESQVCAGDDCVTKPAIWIGDMETPSIRCGITDGDRQYVGLDRHTGEHMRVGDHTPSLGPRLDSVTFVRNVGEKTAGIDGHLDLMHVDVHRQTLFSGGDRCDVPGTLRNLSEAYGDEYSIPAVDSTKTNVTERFAQRAVGTRATENTILYVVRGGTGANEISQVYLMELGNGVKTALTDERTYAVYARWVVDEYDLSGGTR